MRNTHNAAQRRRLAVLAVPAGLTLIALVALAGCSSSGQDMSSNAAGHAAVNGLAPGGQAAVASASAAGPAAMPSASPTAADFGANGAGGGSAQSSSARLAGASQQIIYTAQLTVRAHSVSAAVAHATSIVNAAGGYVSGENASTDPNHPDRATATITLKIPVGAYGTTLSQLSGLLGTQLSLQQQAQDVTEQVADVNSRVASDVAAIAQLRALLRHAGTVADLLSVQNQINSQESDLEALQAQQSALNHETAYATVTVTVLGPKVAPKAVKPKAPKPPPGFTKGISGGWHAFRTSVSWFLAIIGAVAPFAAVLAVLGGLAYWLRRRLARRRSTV
jgi:hypothetical protein